MRVSRNQVVGILSELKVKSYSYGFSKKTYGEIKSKIKTIENLLRYQEGEEIEFQSIGSYESALKLSKRKPLRI